jgi:two-component system sensor histidine kinase HydH
VNRRLLLRIATPAVGLGALLLGACLVIAWQINRLEQNLTSIVSQNVRSLEAAQELEISVRQLRNHCFLYLIEPTPARLAPIQEDNSHFEQALEVAQKAAHSPEERKLLVAIQTGYRQYREELEEEVAGKKPRTDLAKFSDTHPIVRVTDPCHELFRLNKEEMHRTAEESNGMSRQAQLWLLLLGLLGPAGGLLIGYSVARSLRRSIYKLSVRVQDMAQRLDQNVASMSVSVDGDMEHLDRQMEHVVGRVEEVAERLQRHQRQMLRAEQLAAVGQLAASVAHEVRNPLTSVKMLIEAARRPKNGMPLTSEDLDVIHGEVTRLEQTVQSFLNFARLPAPKRSPCDLRRVLQQAVELVKARARQQGVAIAIVVRQQQGAVAEDADVPAYADAGQLCTVLVNLFLNALDAMPRGGRLEVDLEVADDGQISLNVSDSGPGIAPEMAERLFTPFASSKATGTGLGLSISRRIIEEHGGQIIGGNRPGGGGARFTISLPASAVPEPVGQAG